MWEGNVMLGRSAVLIDNTTIDSAARLLTESEITRRSTVGWCLRDLSDLSCLSCLLDAFIYYDDIYTLPYGIVPITTQIGGLESRSVRDTFRKHTKRLPLSPSQIDEVRNITDELANDFLQSSAVGKGEIFMPSLGRAVYAFQRDARGRLDIYPEKSAIPKEESILALKRAIVYAVAGSTQRNHSNFDVWLSPERFLLARRFSLSVKEGEIQRQGFNKLLAGFSAQWVSAAPSLVFLLATAKAQHISNFADYFVTELDNLRNQLNLRDLRNLFHSHVANPITRAEADHWVTYGALREKILDLVGLVPTVGPFVQVLLKWFQDPALQITSSLINYHAESRSFLRNVANEVRYLKVSDVSALVISNFASPETEKQHYYSHQLAFCIDAFQNVLAGNRSEFLGSNQSLSQII